ncbi:MAG: hypothetical protein VX737_00260 [Pseudomonadota bacterium]|nr:hypothetical protein [Pseudomonadota bacterium]
MNNKSDSTYSSYLTYFSDSLCPRQTSQPEAQLPEAQIIGRICNIFKVLDSARNLDQVQPWQTAKERIVELLLANGRYVVNKDLPSIDYSSYTIRDLARHMQAIELDDTPSTTLCQSLFPCFDCSEPMPKPQLHRYTALGTRVDRTGTPLALTMLALEKFTRDWISKEPLKIQTSPMIREPEPILSDSVRPEQKNSRIVTLQPNKLQDNIPLQEGSPSSAAEHPSI